MRGRSRRRAGCAHGRSCVTGAPSCGEADDAEEAGASRASRGRGPRSPALLWAWGVALLARADNNGFPERGRCWLELRPLGPRRGGEATARGGGWAAGNTRAEGRRRRLKRGPPPWRGSWLHPPGEAESRKHRCPVRPAAFAARSQDFPAGVSRWRGGAAIGPPAPPPRQRTGAWRAALRARVGGGEGGGKAASPREPVTGGAAPAGASPAAVTWRRGGAGAARECSREDRGGPQA